MSRMHRLPPPVRTAAHPTLGLRVTSSAERSPTATAVLWLREWISWEPLSRTACWFQSLRTHRPDAAAKFPTTMANRRYGYSLPMPAEYTVTPMFAWLIPEERNPTATFN